MSVAVAASPVAVRRRSLAFDRGLTLASLIVGYMGYYLCRQNFSAAAPLMGLPKETFGAIASAGTLVYAIGKLLGGPLTDARGGRTIFFAGLFGSVAATMALGGFGGSIVALYAFWCVNRLVQSAGWGGLLSVLSRWYSKKDYGAASGVLSISYQLGGAVASAVCGALVAFGWRALFFGPAALLLALGLGLRFTLKGDPASVGHAPVEEPGPAQSAVDPAAVEPGALDRVRSLLRKPLFLVVLALAFVLTLIRESFNTWLPTYFHDMGSKADLANVKSALFPLLGCGGTILAGLISDRLGHGRRGPILAVFLAGAGLALLGLGHPAAVAAWTGLSLDCTVLVLTGLTGFFILAPYSMVGGGVLALDAGGKRAAATAAGLLDGIGYLGASLAGLGVAEAVKRAGWQASFTAMAIAVFVCAALAVGMYLFVERRRA